MLGADIMMPHETGFVHCQFDDPFGAGGQHRAAKGGAVPSPHGAFHRVDDFIRGGTEFAQHFGRDAVTFLHQP